MYYDDRDNVTNEMGSVNANEQRASGSSVTNSGKKVKKGSVVGKIAGTIALGILLGLTAGATLFVMNSIRDGRSDKSVQSLESIIEDQNADTSTAASDADEAKKDIASAILEEGDILDRNNSSSGIVAYDVSDIAEMVMPSVVSISGDYTITGRNFWGQTYAQQTQGSGSGIIIGKDDKTLLIATNNHVVENSDSLTVQFIDGTTAEARVKGTDEAMDLAIILADLDQIDSDTMDKIDVAKLGDSESLKPGEAAIVIGNALGYGQSVTAGVISAVDRSLTASDGTTIDGLIQTDAAINPGNSGGALVNSDGEVVGISSSKISGSSVDSMGFAIPISKAEPILSDIVTSADRVKVADSKAGYLGIGGVTVTDEVSNMYNIPVGVVVRQVYDGTGAADAGLIPGDVIYSVAGKKLESMEDLRGELEYHEAGTTVEIGFYRYDEGEYSEKTAEIRLVNRDGLNNSEKN